MVSDENKDAELTNEEVQPDDSLLLVEIYEATERAYRAASMSGTASTSVAFSTNA